METLDRYKGCLLGLAVGDAVGTTVEFKPRGTFEPVTDMTGGGPFKLEVGQWTDDTSMALCLGQSLIDCNGFDAKDQIQKYVDWYENGYMSSNGVCFDIGNTTVRALRKYYSYKDPFAGSKSRNAAGNGGIMRLAPVPMAYMNDFSNCVNYCEDSSRVTHASSECIESAALLGLILKQALSGYAKEELFEIPSKDLPLHKIFNEPKVLSIINNEFVDKKVDEIKGSGYVIESLEAALWCFYHTNNYADAILTATNLGDDADTTAAIVGQIAGAHYGISGIPFGWLDKLAKRDMIEDMSIKLYELSNKL